MPFPVHGKKLWKQHQCSWLDTYGTWLGDLPSANPGCCLYWNPLGPNQGGTDLTWRQYWVQWWASVVDGTAEDSCGAAGIPVSGSKAQCLCPRRRKISPDFVRSCGVDLKLKAGSLYHWAIRPSTHNLKDENNFFHGMWTPGMADAVFRRILASGRASCRPTSKENKGEWASSCVHNQKTTKTVRNCKLSIHLHDRIGHHVDVDRNSYTTVNHAYFCGRSAHTFTRTLLLFSVCFCRIFRMYPH